MLRDYLLKPAKKYWQSEVLLGFSYFQDPLLGAELHSLLSHLHILPDRFNANTI